MARDINKWVVVGRITKDCEFGYMNSGSAKADFSIAVNDSKKNGNEWVNEVSYFNITVWGKSAENLKDYLKKGQQVCIEAKLKQDRWEKDGKNFSAIKVVTENIQLLGGKRSDGNSESTTGEMTPASQNVDMNDFPEDVPF